MDKYDQAVLRQIADEAASKAIAETFTKLGVNTSDVFETQKDMAALREVRALLASDEFQQDLAHLRRWRKSMDDIKSKGLFAALSLVAFGAIAAILFAFRVKIFGP